MKLVHGHYVALFQALLLSAAGGQKLGRWNGIISFPDFQSGSETRKEATIRVKINFAPLWITLAL